MIMVPDVSLSCSEDIGMTKSVFYLIALWGLLTSFGASAAGRCTGLSLTYKFPESIDVTNMKVGDKLYGIGTPDFRGSFSGTCRRERGGGTAATGSTLNQYIYLVDKYGNPPATGCAVNKSPQIRMSKDGYLQFISEGNCFNSMWRLLWSASHREATSGQYPFEGAVGGNDGRDAGTIYLAKKIPPGKTVVNPSFFFTKNFYSQVGEYTTGLALQKELVAFSAPTSMTLINNASCAVSVNDVTFGDQTVPTVKTNSVESKTINIDFTCNAVLPAYTLSISGRDGANNATNGVINVKNNSSVGYQFTWGNNTVKPVNSAVTVNGIAITPNTKPTTNSFTIPITVKPVALSTQPIPGLANTALTINVKLN